MTGYETVKDTIQLLRVPIHPPSEADVLAWVCKQKPEDKAMLRFILALYAPDVRDIEDLKIAGQTT